MDEVRIWNIGLVSSGVSLIYRTSLGANAGLYNGLVMSITFQNSNGSGTLFSLNDACGNSNNGVNRGVTGFSMESNPSNLISINDCVMLDGTDDYLAGPDHSAVSPVSGVTLEAWIYPNSFNASTSIYSTLIHKGNSSGSVTDYRVQIQKKKFQFLINETDIFGLNTSGEFFPLNQWTHFALTYNGSNGMIQFFLNGEIRWDDTNFVGNIHNNTDSVYIGGTPNLECFDGYIDEVKITSSELSYETVSNKIFTSVNETNDPSGVNVVYNFDGGLASNSDTGPRLTLRGNSRFLHNASTANSPDSPLSFSSDLNFTGGFYLSGSVTAALGRIPNTTTIGFMTSDTIDVPLSETITDVNVFVGLNHTDEDNLVLTLISPSGATVTLYSTSSLINNSDNLITIFDDNADSTLESNKYVMFSPVIKPLNSINSVLSGANTKGKWKLRIQDVALGDTGRLYGWGIQFNDQTQRKKILSLTSLIQGLYNPSTNLMIQDTVKVSVRNGNSPYNLYETAARKMSDSGKADFVFTLVPDGTPVYLQLKHRNSIETWSRKSSSAFFAILNSIHFLPFTSNLKYDFTLSLSSAFGNNMIQVDTGPNKFAVYSGDVNQDGVIDGTDTQLIDNDAFNFLAGYLVTDINGDGFTDGSDGLIAGNNSDDFVSAVVP